MVAGFLLGPSFFGWLLPSVQSQLFPQESLRVLFVISQLGLVLYMFCVGLEFRPDLMFKHARRAAGVSIAGIVVPFAFGAAIALALYRGAAASSPSRSSDFKRSCSSAPRCRSPRFPMLARIIYERGITGTAIGTLALAAGAMDDAAAWIILAIVVGSFTGSNWLAVAAAGGAIVYVLLVSRGRAAAAGPAERGGRTRRFTSRRGWSP